MTSSPKPGRLGVGIIGAGRVGAVLGSALRAVGHQIIGATAVSQDSRDRIDALLPGVSVITPQEVVERAELVVIAVPDDALAGVVQGLADVNAWQPGQIVVHTSGAHGISALAPASAKGVIPIAIHPAMTFTGTSLDLSRLEGATFAVTAPAPVLPIGQALVVEIGGEPVILDESARGLYHAALAHGANHLVVLVAQAADMLAKAGIENPGAALSPLLYAALEGALRNANGVSDPVASLTGPVVRGDAGTVSKHLDTIAQFAMSDGVTDIVDSYRALGKSATVRSLELGRINQFQAEQLLDTFNAETPAS